MLVEGSWIDDHANLLICGPSGVGKSWLASAVGNSAADGTRSMLATIIRVSAAFSSRADATRPTSHFDDVWSRAPREFLGRHRGANDDSDAASAASLIPEQSKPESSAMLQFA
jgi:IstB-like ATP binding protein